MKHRVVESPLGRLTLVVDEHDALAGLYLDGQQHHPAMSTLGEPDDSIAADAVAQLDEYFAGRRSGFDLVLAPAGTDFQVKVWRALTKIPPAKTESYGELAAELGQPTAARAVGAAIGLNPISIIVPCHRVVGTSGAMTGYAGGLERKQWLLGHERQHWG